MSFLTVFFCSVKKTGELKFLFLTVFFAQWKKQVTWPIRILQEVKSRKFADMLLRLIDALTLGEIEYRSSSWEQIINLYGIRKYFLVFNIFYKQLAKVDAIIYGTLHVNLVSQYTCGPKKSHAVYPKNEGTDGICICVHAY